MKSAKTFKAILNQHRGIGPGFDIVRIMLASLIFIGHAKAIAGHGTADHLIHGHAMRLAAGNWEGPRRPLQVSLVPMFFAVSGFLVAGSAIRLKTITTFLAFRSFRIFPALLVEVTLSALVLGPIFTSLSLKNYLSDPHFARYFGNVIGLVTFTLPGVFIHNNWPLTVNANLWTLPSEFDCYLIAAVMMAIGVIYSRKIYSIVFVIMTIIFVTLNLLTQFGVTETTLAPTAVDYYFFVGVMFFHWRDHTPYRIELFITGIVLSYIFLLFHHTVFLAAPFLTYAVLFVGMSRLPAVPLLATGDYSYGVYLYGFPITQAVVSTFPSLRGRGWETVAVAALATLCFAVTSWHLLEKPTLAQRARLPKRLFPTAAARIIPEPPVRTEEAQARSVRE